MAGSLAVIGGAAGMAGAAMLAGRAALRLGAGRVYGGLLEEHALDPGAPELMLRHPDDVLGLDLDAIVIGPGLGQGERAETLLGAVLASDLPCVLDADALNLIALRPDLRGMLHDRKSPSVFTPHPGEAARLLACSTEDIQADRAGAARKLAQKLGGSVVLKGAGSLCATTDGKLHLNQTGNPGMSAAGMGDVLSGMIAAFIAQGLSADEALLLAVHLHGAAGDELAQQQATIGMSATEVTEWARWLLNRIAPN